MSARRDYYEILGISRSASQDDIKRAYRRLAREYHPDVNKSPDAEARFKEINEAYQVLCDPQRRANYDRFGRADVSGFGDMDFGFGGLGDIFEDFFGFGVRPRGPQARAQRGSDLRYDLTLEFEEAAFGCEKEIEVSRLDTCPRCNGTGAEPGTEPIRCPECQGTGQVRHVRQSLFGSFVTMTTCPRCHGEGEVVITSCQECRGNRRVRVTKKLEVTIPAGVDSGLRLRLDEEGEAGLWGGSPGDLYLHLSVKKHRYFKRQNSDILLELPINIAQAALGDEVEVPTLEGTTTLAIPAGTQTGETFRLKKKGIPHLRGDGRGDQLVTVYVVTPTNLTEEQRDLLKRLSKSLGKEVIPQSEKGFLDRIREALNL
jgi:molecular chaperone DnaJ